MLQTLKRYTHIIKEYHISTFEQFDANLRFRAKVILKDHSILYVRETIIGGKIRKYSYHWQKKDKLLVRWDNAPDWEVRTFPHHKHIGEQIEPSYERTLEHVFRFISERLKE